MCKRSGCSALLGTFVLFFGLTAADVTLGQSLDSDYDEQGQTDSAVDSIALTEEQQHWRELDEKWKKMNRQTGDITLGKSGATLHVNENFYFLNSQDAETVLVDFWGNMPGQQVLGMIFPAHMTPFERDSWAATVSYQDDGFVTDDDADDIDYQELLQTMKKDTHAESEQRIAQGYAGIELLGWAASPFYDEVNHKYHWAKELHVDGAPDNTLNYNIRVLGRRGVLLVNFIAGMAQKSDIDNSLDQVLAMADFDQGSSYDDFDPDVDKVAAYGLGALVAGKVLTKAGILAGLLVFLKKFAVLIIGGLTVWGRNFFARFKK